MTTLLNIAAGLCAGYLIWHFVNSAYQQTLNSWTSDDFRERQSGLVAAYVVTVGLMALMVGGIWS